MKGFWKMMRQYVAPYGKYLERKRNLMIAKFVILGVANIAFVIAYFAFVKGA